jgi:ATP-dependent DNA ligase
MAGSGFSQAELKEMAARRQALKVASPAAPLDETPQGITRVQPEPGCDLIFQEETSRGHCRAPAFIRLIE